MNLINFSSMEMDLHFSVASGELFSLFGFPVTNSLLTGLVGLLAVVGILFYAAKKIKRGKYNRFVGLIQWVFEALFEQINDVISDAKVARRVAPLAITIFFVVLINYWISVLPGLDSIKYNGIPLLRSSTADLNFTFGLAIITMIAVQIYAIKNLGVFGNGKRYFRNPFKDPIGAFEGLLELVGEASRGVALSLRLFGNAFAGEVLLVIVAVISSYAAVVALPIFMIFEMFIGFIQAYVFFMLTIIFTALAVTHGDEHNEHPNHNDNPENFEAIVGGQDNGHVQTPSPLPADIPNGKAAA